MILPGFGSRLGKNYLASVWIKGGQELFSNGLAQACAIIFLPGSNAGVRAVILPGSGARECGNHMTRGRMKNEQELSC